MAELEEKLNAILSDPEAMGQIASIARALTGGGMPSPDPEPAPEAPPAPPVVYEPVEPLQTGGASEPGGEAPLDWSALLGALRGLSGGDTGAGSNSPLSLLGDLDPALVQKGLRLFSEYSAADDQRAALLSALKPFLKEERQAKVEKAVRLARLSRVVRTAFQLFQKEGSDHGAL